MGVGGGRRLLERFGAGVWLFVCMCYMSNNGGGLGARLFAVGCTVKKAYIIAPSEN